MFIIMTLIITVYIDYTILQQTWQPIRSLAYCTFGHNANNTHNVCKFLTSQTTW